jgi:hypothetical protein
MKDKSIKDEIMYEVQYYNDRIDDWDTADEAITSKKEAKSIVRFFKHCDKEEGIKFKYRIVKLTIKSEVVK